MSDDETPPAPNDFAVAPDPNDQLVTSTNDPASTDKAVLQAQMELPNHIVTTANGTVYQTPGVTDPGVEKQWDAPETVTNPDGTVTVLANDRAGNGISPIKGVTG